MSGSLETEIEMRICVHERVSKEMISGKTCRGVRDRWGVEKAARQVLVSGDAPSPSAPQGTVDLTP